MLKAQRALKVSKKQRYFFKLILKSVHNDKEIEKKIDFLCHRFTFLINEANFYRSTCYKCLLDTFNSNLQVYVKN